MSTGRKSQEHWASFFREEFAKESDRAAVILAASMLEQALKVVLRTALVPCTSHEDPLFDSAYAPLSTFKAKIELSYRVGLISRSEASILNLTRKIRNDFAHNVTGCTFEDASIHSRVVELARIAGVVSANPEIREGYPQGIKGDFQMTISWVLWTLWGRADKTVPIVEELIDWKPPSRSESRRRLPEGSLAITTDPSDG